MGSQRNKWTHWKQGSFVDGPKYSRWSKQEKDRANEQEKLLVRPSPTGNALCQCQSPEDAEWIAERLNLAARLEDSSDG